MFIARHCFHKARACAARALPMAAQDMAPVSRRDRVVSAEGSLMVTPGIEGSTIRRVDC